VHAHLTSEIKLYLLYIYIYIYIYRERESEGGGGREGERERERDRQISSSDEARQAREVTRGSKRATTHQGLDSRLWDSTRPLEGHPALVQGLG